MEPPTNPLKEKVKSALARLNELLHKKAVTGKFCILDNWTRVIALQERNTTYDLKVAEMKKIIVLNSARQVANEFSLEGRWMNFRPTFFISKQGEVTHKGITILYHENQIHSPKGITNSPETTLCESMLFTTNSLDFDDVLADFLDRFNLNPSNEMLVEEPALLAAKFNDDGLADAYLASTAAYLCQQRGLNCPIWVNQPSRVFEKPWFAAKSPNLKAILLQESPAAFRVRNLFVSANALSRA